MEIVCLLFAAALLGSFLAFATSQEAAGTQSFNTIFGAAMGDDGSVVLAGATNGSWNNSNDDSEDFAAIKLAADGTVRWRWQVTQQWLPYANLFEKTKNKSAISRPIISVPCARYGPIQNSSSAFF